MTSDSGYVYCKDCSVELEPYVNYTPSCRPNQCHECYNRDRKAKRKKDRNYGRSLYEQGKVGPYWYERHTRNGPPWASPVVDSMVMAAREAYIKLDGVWENSIAVGYVYQARQKHIDGVSKIGFSSRPEDRIKAVNTFLLPDEEFFIVKAWPVADKKDAEKWVHQYLKNYRAGDKEIFIGSDEALTWEIDLAMNAYNGVRL